MLQINLLLGRESDADLLLLLVLLHLLALFFADIVVVVDTGRVVNLKRILHLPGRRDFLAPVLTTDWA